MAKVKNNRSSNAMLDHEFWRDVKSNLGEAGRGAMRGLATGLPGAAVDVVNMAYLPAANALGYAAKPEDTVGSSAWFARQGDKRGLLPVGGSIPFLAGEMLGPVAVGAAPDSLGLLAGAAGKMGNALGDIASDYARHRGPSAQRGIIGYFSPDSFASGANFTRKAQPDMYQSAPNLYDSGPVPGEVMFGKNPTPGEVDELMKDADLAAIEYLEKYEPDTLRALDLAKRSDKKRYRKILSNAGGGALRTIEADKNMYLWASQRALHDQAANALGIPAGMPQARGMAYLEDMPFASLQAK